MCESKCSDKCANTTCHQDTAECLYGCIEGYVGSQCTQETTGPASENSNFAMILGTSVGAGVAVIVLVIVLVICFIKRRRSTCAQKDNGINRKVRGTHGEDKPSVLEFEETDAAAIYAKPNKPKRTILEETNAVYDTTYHNRSKKVFNGNNDYDIVRIGSENTPDTDKEKPNQKIVNGTNTIYNTTNENKKTKSFQANRDYDVISTDSKKAPDTDMDNPKQTIVDEVNDVYDTTQDNKNKKMMQVNNDYAVIIACSETAPKLDKKHETGFELNKSTSKRISAEINDPRQSVAAGPEIRIDLSSTEQNKVLPNDMNAESAVTERELAQKCYNDTETNLRKIHIDKLAKFVAKRTKDEFIEEFERLPTGLTKPHTEASKRENIAKNRYRGIYPYDDARIVLKEGESDYINASYIDEYKTKKAYIASIGPTHKYMGDMSPLWRMVWQENIGKIVMLTNLSEAGAPKCDQYWPNQDACLTYADIAVTCLGEERYADYTVRRFNVQKPKSEKRVVNQVHFTAWPDKGVPDDVFSLVEFRHKVNSTTTDQHGPILVHCSAGIGRTGTYIALDILTEEGEAEGYVDIYTCVNHMRDQRVNMVQNVEQYQYLYNALVHTLTFDSTAIAASRFRKYMKTQVESQLEAQFLQLQTTVENRSEEEENAERRNKALNDNNRQDADIPGDRNRPRLYLDRTTESSQYINALYVNSYRRTNRFVVAQTPLPNTVEDFLALIVQENVSCIVSMETDLGNNKTVGCYYPNDNSVLKKGAFTVKSDLGKGTDQYQLRTLKITHEGNSDTEEIRVKHIEYTKWSSEQKVPEEPAKFLKFMQNVEQVCDGNENKGPLLVHCLTGAEKSGLFCVISVLLEKTQIDQEISVVNTVRQIKHRRHMSIPNKEQYMFCHKCLDEYLRTFDAYSNFGLQT